MFKNKFYLTYMASVFFNQIGTSLFNLVFIVYASLFHSGIFVFIANIILILPALLDPLAGRYADLTRKKGRSYLLICWCQAVLFLFVALVMKEVVLFSFSIVALINFVSDLLGEYGSGLLLFLIKRNIGEEQLGKFFSMRQFVLQFALLLGQFFGVVLLELLEGNFQILAIVNAVTFVLAACVLLIARETFNKEQDTSQPGVQERSFSNSIKSVYRSMNDLFQEKANSDFMRLLTLILLVNMLSGSILSIFNFHLSHIHFFSFSYAESLLLVQWSYILGLLLASVLPFHKLQSRSFSNLLRIISLILISLGMVNILQMSLIFSLVLLFSLGYVIGKVNPKLVTLVVAYIPENQLAQSGALIDMLFSMSIPMGTVLFSLFSIHDVLVSWILFTGFAITIFIMSYFIERRN